MKPTPEQAKSATPIILCVSGSLAAFLGTCALLCELARTHNTQAPAVAFAVMAFICLAVGLTSALMVQKYFPGLSDETKKDTDEQG